MIILCANTVQADMHNRQGLTFRLIFQALADYDLWPVYLLGLTWNIPISTVGTYLTLTLRSLGFDTFQTNLLVIPSAVLMLFQLIFWAWFSEKINSRFFIVLISQIWSIPLLVALELIPSSSSPWAKFTLSTLVVGSPFTYPIVGMHHLPSPPILQAVTNPNSRHSQP